MGTKVELTRETKRRSNEMTPFIVLYLESLSSVLFSSLSSETLFLLCGYTEIKRWISLPKKNIFVDLRLLQIFA